MANYILALDQATETTGWSLWKGTELIDYGKFIAKGNVEQRISELRAWLIGRITDVKNGFGNFSDQLEIAIEGIQLQQIPGTSRDGNVDTFRKLAWVQGICIETCVTNKIKHHIISSSTWKSTCGVTGRNRAEQKRNAQAFVLKTYGIKATQDECDAICIGYHQAKESDSVINF